MRNAESRPGERRSGPAKGTPARSTPSSAGLGGGGGAGLDRADLASAIGNAAFGREVAEPGPAAEPTTAAAATPDMTTDGAGLMPGGTVHPTVQNLIASRQGSGSPLAPDDKERFGSQLGDSLDDVRIHTDTSAGGLARAVDAKAFTTGTDVFFGEGEYRPGTAEGDDLIAHELAHAVQLRGAPTNGAMRATDATHPLERAANAGSTASIGAGELTVLARTPTGTVEGASGTQEIEGDVITGGRGDFPTEIRQTMMAVSTRISVNAAHYGLQVKNACEQFKLYADPLLEELEEETTAAELGSALVGSVFGLVGGQLTGKIANEAYKWIAEEVADFIKGQIEDGVKDTLNGGDEVDDLKAVINALVTSANDAATSSGVKAQQAFDTRVTGIYSRLESGAELTDEDDALTMPFYRVPPQQVDQVIEETFGIPAAASAQIAQLEIYAKLVEDFERKYIAATMSMTDSIRMADEEMRGDWNKSLPGTARRRGRYAANQRAASMGLTEDDWIAAGRSFEEAQAGGFHGLTREEYDAKREQFEETRY